MTKIHVGHFSKKEYEVVNEGGDFMVYLRWPSIPWCEQDQLICSGDSLTDACSKIDQRETLIEFGGSVL